MNHSWEAITDWLFMSGRCFKGGFHGYDITKYDRHHKYRNTKGNRKRCPLLIDSVFNIELVEHNYHINHHGECGKMTDLEAMKWERFLQRHPAIAKWGNKPDHPLFGGKQND